MQLIVSRTLWMQNDAMTSGFWYQLVIAISLLHFIRFSQKPNFWKCETQKVKSQGLNPFNPSSQTIAHQSKNSSKKSQHLVFKSADWFPSLTNYLPFSSAVKMVSNIMWIVIISVGSKLTKSISLLPSWPMHGMKRRKTKN